MKCSDGFYYVGSHRGEDLGVRVGEHQLGMGGYTSRRRPVELVYSEWFTLITDAVAAERQIKGWSSAKKEALIAGDFERLQSKAKRRGGKPRASS
ncbi:GIY-YIG nuclease family protein [Maricaulaceae bacterium EIL42A08]|nr:GIY-YIG nuclease family protein [Maricaulaceae bacterium EIL42A08]